MRHLAPERTLPGQPLALSFTSRGIKTSAPSGTVTFLFTDIEGSTRLWEERPEQMQAALAGHDALLRAVIEEHGGHVFKTMGDAFCAAFAPPAAAAAAQRALAADADLATGGDGAGLCVRMALHTGAAEERGGDYFGPPLNRVARLLSAAHGGQMLLSAATHELVRHSLAAGACLRDLGEHRLRDLIRPEHAFQLLAPGGGSARGARPPAREAANRTRYRPCAVGHRRSGSYGAAAGRRRSDGAGGALLWGGRGALRGHGNPRRWRSARRIRPHPGRRPRAARA